MCGLYRIEDSLIYRGFVPASCELVERTRALEREMAGPPVPEAAWDVFFSAACGAIEWAHFERMFQARSAAATYLAVQASTRRRTRPASAFRCIAD